MKNPTLTAATLISVAVSAGCTHSTAATAPTQGLWRLNSAGNLTMPDAAVRFSIEMSSGDTTVTGRVACNRWKGSKAADDAQFRLEHASSTRKRCPVESTALTALEQTFLARLGEGAKSTLQGSEWVLTFADGTSWVFVPHP